MEQSVVEKKDKKTTLHLLWGGLSSPQKYYQLAREAQQQTVSHCSTGQSPLKAPEESP